MPLAPSLPCFDAGGPDCPCPLGMAGKCTYCTRLRGEGDCRCAWSGTCILLTAPAAVNAAAARGSGRSKERIAGHSGDDGAKSAPARPQRSLAVISSRRPAAGAHELWLAIPRGVAPRLAEPGRFVFLRPAGLDRAYDTPLAVAETRRRGLRVLFTIAGPKTQALAEVRAGDRLAWRGPYRAALLGLTRMRRRLGGRPGRLVVVGRGLAPATSLPLIRRFAAVGWEVVALLDSGGAGGKLALAEVGGAIGAAGRTESIACYTKPGAAALRRTVAAAGPLPVVASYGTEVLHRWVGRVLADLRREEAAAGGSPPIWLASNDCLMTCGEGTCGACGMRLPGGERWRGCKADTPPELLFGSAANWRDDE